MSRHEYMASMHLAGQDYPFYALIMAAMRKADTHNQVKLASAFPGTWEELQKRYNAPGGYLPEDGFVKIGLLPSKRHSDCMPGQGCLVGQDDCPFNQEN